MKNLKFDRVMIQVNEKFHKKPLAMIRHHRFLPQMQDTIHINRLQNKIKKKK